MDWGEAMDLLVAGAELSIERDGLRLRLRREDGRFTLRFVSTGREMGFTDVYTALEAAVRVAGLEATGRAVSAARYRCWFPLGSSLSWWRRAAA